MKPEVRLVRLFPVFLSCLWLAACGNVQVKPDQPIGTATLKPTIEDKRAGLVGIAPEFTPKAYRRISVEIPEDTASPPEDGKTLKLQGTITELSGGSRALRFWISFGAGRSRVQYETRMVDAESGAVLLVTADRRIGVMSEAMSLDYGGGSRELLEQTLSDAARDFVLFLTRLAGGQGPSPN